MDIAAFICEQLEHRSVINVPGLGSFYRNRVEGYYNQEQQQFYPPSIQIQFDNELPEDDTLATLLSTEKRISQASASYFIEKFVSNIRQLATTDNVPLGNIGVFNIRQNQLTFTPKRRSEVNELFYGLAPVKLRRNNPYRQQPEEIIPFSFSDIPANPPVQQEIPAVIEDEKPPRPINIWLIIALIIVIAGIGLISVYMYKPALFDRFITPVVKIKPKPEKSVKRSISDSIKQSIKTQTDLGLTPVKLDSTTQKKVLPPEIPTDTFAVVVGTFKTMAGAKRQLQTYTDNGIVEADIHKSHNNLYYQVIMGTYLIKDSAKVHLKIYRKKFRSPGIKLETYPYKKQ